jgi:hypothetical protein
VNNKYRRLVKTIGSYAQKEGKRVRKKGVVLRNYQGDLEQIISQLQVLYSRLPRDSYAKQDVGQIIDEASVAIGKLAPAQKALWDLAATLERFRTIKA